MASNGWNSLGAALAGNGSLVQDAYQRGQTNAARVAGLIADAKVKRDEAVARDQLEQSLVGAGGTPEQAGLIATALRGGFDPTKISGYQGDVQEQGFRGDAVARALAGDWGGANANLIGVANGPVELASVQGQNLIANRLLPGGGGVSTTEQGRAAIGADAARAAASYAQAARTRQGTAIDLRQALEGSPGAASTKAPSGYRWTATGSLEAIPGGPADPAAQSQSKGAPTEGERKSATLLKRLEGSRAQMQQAIAEDRSATTPGILASLAGATPFVGEEARNLANSTARQRVEAAQQDILDAALTLGTGAAYTKEQLKGYAQSYFPQLGDSAATIRDKQDRLQNVIDAAYIAAGRAAPDAGQAPVATISDALAGPSIGSVQDGYRFRGGDPANPANWEKL